LEEVGDWGGNGEEKRERHAVVSDKKGENSIAERKGKHGKKKGSKKKKEGEY